MLAIAVVSVLSPLLCLPTTTAPSGPLVARATEIRELRIADLRPKPKDEDGGVRFSSTFDKPGITLSLAVQLPIGASLLSIEQPEKIIAKDSTGLDLTAIESGFRDEKEYLKTPSFSGFKQETSTDALIELHLSSSSRKAESLDIACDTTVVIGGEAITVELPASPSWTAMKLPEFAGVKAEYRTIVEGDETKLEFKTDSIKSRIKEVFVATGENRAEANGWMVMNGELTYSMNAKIGSGSRLMIETWKDVQELPLKIDIKAMKLP